MKKIHILLGIAIISILILYITSQVLKSPQDNNNLLTEEEINYTPSCKVNTAGGERMVACDHLIVQFNANITNAEINQLIKDIELLGGEVNRRANLSYWFTVSTPTTSIKELDNWIIKLEKIQYIESASYDTISDGF